MRILNPLLSNGVVPDSIPKVVEGMEMTTALFNETVQNIEEKPDTQRSCT